MQATFVRLEASPKQAFRSIGNGDLPASRGSYARSRSGNACSNTPSDRSLIEALSSSKVFQEYERAFTEATGMPVALRPVEAWHLPHHGKRNEGPFCSLISERSRACASCLQVQEKLSRAAVDEAVTLGCPNGMCDTAVPVRLGDRVIGYLQTGQVFRQKPTQKQFNRVVAQVREWGVIASEEELRTAFFSTKIIPPRRHESVVKLLAIFAQHLAILSNQVVVRHENMEPPVIIRARNYIHEHHAENLRLGHVAKAVNTSTFYFCKMFKRVTGINFTDYLSRVRIEKSKNLLLNPNLRVSEIAFDVGFQSLTHFNRVFKKILGQSPSEYRAQLLGTSTSR